MKQPQKRTKGKSNQAPPIGIFASRQKFLAALLIMGLILGFYHLWYEILAQKPAHFVQTFFRDFPITALESTFRLLPLLLPFYMLLGRLRTWPIWKRVLLLLLLAVSTTIIEEYIEFYLPSLNGNSKDISSDRFLAFLSFDMLGDVLLFLGILSGLAYVDHILCHNQELFAGLSEKNARLAEAEKLRLMAEFQALQNQINPHFLFNTLNSLATLVLINPSKAQTLIRDMSDWYRDVLTTTRQDTWTIQDEIELIQNYLRIESVRLEERLTVKIHCAPEAKNIIIPPLVLQPLVENAILHGIAPSVSGGTLTVTIQSSAQAFSISVEDKRHDSKLVVEHHQTGSGSGLQNIKRRLELAFGEDMTFQFDLSAQGAIATIIVDRGNNAV